MASDTETRLPARRGEQGDLRALAEDAGEAGMARALERIGLADPAARADVDELRQLLAAWRDAKRAARDAVVAWVVRIALALIMFGMAMKFGLVPPMHG
jgi:hypothetical protein